MKVTGESLSRVKTPLRLAEVLEFGAHRSGGYVSLEADEVPEVLFVSYGTLW